MNHRVCLATIGCVSLLAGLTAAQGSAPGFQFASIKRTAPDPPSWDPCLAVLFPASRPSPIGSGCGVEQFLAPPFASSLTVLAGGRFEARRQTIENLARVAYGFEHVDPRRGVVDGSGIPQDQFDITAAIDGEWTTPPPGETTPAELRPLLRTLLEERFALKARVQTRNINVYALRLVSKSGTPGPGLRRSAGTCTGPYTEAAPNAPDAKPKCAFRLDDTDVEAGAVTMPELARILSRILGMSHADRVVVDQTGLPGTYDLMLSLAFKSPRTARAASTSSEPAVQIPGQLTANSIEISGAIERQLGLTLQKASAPIPTLILERARKPVDD